jgi:hypothetical protein
MRRLSALICVLFTVTFGLVGCGGGGGGGGEFFGPAEVSLRANPESFFIGDRTLLTAELSQVNDDGVVLVYRFPTALSYVPNSAKLVLGDTEVSVTPLLNQAKDENVYLVFVFPQSSFSEDAAGNLQLQLQGIEKKESAEIELDPSIRNLLVPNDQQFDINNPVFGTDISVTVEVKSS